MNEEKRGILSVVMMEDVAEVGLERESILASCFTTEELNELRERHVRSTAGNLALKRAIAGLFVRKWGIELREQDISISRSSSGAPLCSLPPDSKARLPGFDKRFLFLSISHSRTTAYGLAVYQERAND